MVPFFWSLDGYTYLYGIYSQEFDAKNLRPRTRRWRVWRCRIRRVSLWRKKQQEASASSDYAVSILLDPDLSRNASLLVDVQLTPLETFSDVFTQVLYSWHDRTYEAFHTGRWIGNDWKLNRCPPRKGLWRQLKFSHKVKMDGCERLQNM